MATRPRPSPIKARFVLSCIYGHPSQFERKFTGTIEGPPPLRRLLAKLPGLLTDKIPPETRRFSLRLTLVHSKRPRS